MARPNIIFITVDGMRWNSLGFLGHPDIRTPNLDALASHGLIFTEAAVCRLQSHLVSATPFFNAPDTPPSERNLLLKRLREVGYQANAAGFVAPEPGSCDQLLRTGGDEADDDYLRWFQAEKERPMQGVAFSEDARHVTTWIGNQAVRFCQSGEEPFFLWAGFANTGEPPLPWRDMYDPGALRRPADTAPNQDDVLGIRLAAYYGTLSHIDRQVGRMLATLTARGRTNNIFVVTATRGACLGHHGIYEDKSGPLYDSMVRVPLIVGGLMGQRKGEQDPALVSVSDIPATLLEALNLPTTGLHDSRSLLPQLKRTGHPHRRILCAEGEDGMKAMRTARYKWIVHEKTGREYLFDLQNDPYEQKNLSNTRQALAIRKMLTGLL